MANHKSALKRHRQSEKKRQRNVTVKSAVKTAVKKATEAISAGKPEDAQKAFKEAASLLDRSVTKGVLHRNNAARKISKPKRIKESYE